MRVNLSRGRSALISAFLVVAFSIGLSLTVNQTVLARTTSSGSGCSSRYGNWQGDQNCNSSERNQSYNRCLTTSNTYWGSMWLGNGGYYNDTLIIESNATEVDASIRGSMLRCTMDSAPNGYNPWAIEVRKARVGDRMRIIPLRLRWTCRDIKLALIELTSKGVCSLVAHYALVPTGQTRERNFL